MIWSRSTSNQVKLSQSLVTISISLASSICHITRVLSGNQKEDNSFLLFSRILSRFPQQILTSRTGYDSKSSIRPNKMLLTWMIRFCKLKNPREIKVFFHSYPKTPVSLPSFYLPTQPPSHLFWNSNQALPLSLSHKIPKFPQWALDISPDWICITKTWLTSLISEREFYISIFSLYCTFSNRG